MLETSAATVGRVRERFWRQGLDAALERAMPDRVYKRSLDGRAEAHLIALACSQAPEGRDRWSMHLLAEKAVELGIVESVSHETVRKTLKKRTPSPPGQRVGTTSRRTRRLPSTKPSLPRSLGAWRARSSLSTRQYMAHG